jgi:hypothetical protein
MNIYQKKDRNKDVDWRQKYPLGNAVVVWEQVRQVLKHEGWHGKKLVHGSERGMDPMHDR